MSRDGAAVGAYRALLRCYPHEFRDEYGTDMVQLLRDQIADESAWRVCARTAADLALSIPHQHLEAHMNLPSSNIVPLAFTALSASGLLFAIVGGSNLAIVAIGLVVAVLAGTTAAIAWRRAAPVQASTSTDAWWKLIVVGPCIIIGVIVAANLGVEAWFAGVLAVLVAFVITGTGLLLGITRFARRRSRTVTS